MPTADRSAREHLGRLLAARRVEISTRYRNRRTFAADTGLNWRTLYDIETGRRDNFRDETLRAFEAAYQLAPGSLDRAFASGGLEPQPPPSPVLLPPGLGGDGDVSPGTETDRAFINAVRLLAAQDHKDPAVILREIRALVCRWPGGGAEESPGVRESA
jgi:hypothetical protein